jgi:hypothetical protein
MYYGRLRLFAERPERQKPQEQLDGVVGRERAVVVQFYSSSSREWVTAIRVFLLLATQ